jgi:hypothetical protein
MSVAKAQAALHGRRLAWTASLRPSLALLPAPLFRVLVWLKADGSTLRCRDRSALAHEPRLTGKMISEISSLSCNDLQGLTRKRKKYLPLPNGISAVNFPN